MNRLLILFFILFKSFFMFGQNSDNLLFLGVDMFAPFDSLAANSCFDVFHTQQVLPGGFVEDRLQFRNKLRYYLDIPVKKLDLSLTETNVQHITYRKVRLFIYPTSGKLKDVSVKIFQLLGLAYQNLLEIDGLKFKSSENVHFNILGSLDENGDEFVVISVVIFH